MKPMLSAATALLIAGSASADITWYAPEDYDIAWVLVSDEAENGCWTNISEVQTYAEDQMKLAGFNVADGPDAGADAKKAILTNNGIALLIEVSGTRLNDGLCVGYVHMVFYGSVINPNRDEYTIANPIGWNPNPWSVWNDKNFNTYALDYVKDVIPRWVERGFKKVDD